MRAVVIDWLGRGGIAQTSAVWARELRRFGVEVVVVTRPGRDLRSDVEVSAVATGGSIGRVISHRSVVHAAEDVIMRARPDVVVVQNYLLPFLEARVFDAAQSVGALVAFVIHDHRLHTWQAGMRWGLRKNLVRADMVLAHSGFVARNLADLGEVEVEIVPLPRVVGALASTDPVPLLPAGQDGDRLALHFGVVKRGYKGVEVIQAMSAEGLPGWRFGCVGVGSPVGSPGLSAIPRFLTEGELAAVVAASDVSLLPYRLATQSGAVALAQSVGSVPIASAVGGIPEQIRHGETGLLVAPGAPASDWLSLLRGIGSADLARMGRAAEQQSHRSHEAFVSAVAKMAGARS